MSAADGGRTPGADDTELLDLPAQRLFDEPEALTELVARGNDLFGPDSTPESILAWGAEAGIRDQPHIDKGKWPGR